VVAERVAQQTALRADRLEVRARLSHAAYRAAATANELATAKEQLNHLLGRAVEQDFALEPVGAAPAEELSLAAAVDRALDRRPDLAKARLGVAQADVQRRIKKAELIPEVSLAVTYTSYLNVDLLPRNVAMAGVKVTWEPFDWGRRGKERAQKALEAQAARTAEREAESAARVEVGRHFRALQEARLAVEAGRLGKEAAHERLRVALRRHEEETALLKDVLDAEATLSTANADYDRALLAFWTSRADFRLALGEEQ
jgi:outer membrane protein TolC